MGELSAVLRLGFDVPLRTEFLRFRLEGAHYPTAPPRATSKSERTGAR
jgi:hypothetical protein